MNYMKNSSLSLSDRLIKTPGVNAILKLSAVSVQCSSYFAIRGVRGVGKSTSFPIIIAEWKKAKIPHKPYYFQCMPDSDDDETFRNLAATLVGRKLPVKELPTVRDVIVEVETALAANKSNFLFVDDSHYIDDDGWESLMAMHAAIRGRGIPLGMAVTDRFLTHGFRNGRYDPHLLDIVHLATFDRDLMFSVIEETEPRLGQLANAYFKGDPKVVRLAEDIKEVTRGNFAAISSLLAIIRNNLRRGQATEKDVRQGLLLRSADDNLVRSEFRLSA